MKKFVGTAFLVGIAVSCALLAFYWIVVRNIDASTQLKDGFERVQLVIWPSSFWLMATGNHTIADFVILALAIAANGICYALLGLIIHALRTAVRSSS